MRTFGHARLGLRLARREARRHPWRTSLVLLMVVIPTLGMTVGATLLRTGEWSAADRHAAEYGRADTIASLEPGADGQVAPDGEGRLRASLPGGTYVIVHDVQDRLRLEDRRAYLTVSDLDLDHPVVDGRYGPVDGRLPIEDDEAVLTTDLLADLDLDIGDTVTPERLGRDYIVVGSVESLGYGQETAFVTGPVPGRFVSTRAYIDRPNVLRPVEPIRGWSVAPAGYVDCFDCDSNSRDAGVFWTYLGGAVALLVLGTVIAAAFAVGARRQLRTIGLLSATGGSPRTVRWFLLAQGVIGGALGALLGVGLGVALTRLIPDEWLESLTDRPVGGPVTRTSDVVPILLIGTLAAVGAAWLPARSAARVPTLQALAGRRPQPKVPPRLPLVGALAVGCGCVLLALAVAGDNIGDSESILVAVAGSIAVLGGTLAVGPWAIAGLEHLSGAWPESGRLAGRSLARSRLRSSAVVGAICALSATVIAGSTLYRTFDAENDDCCSRDYVSSHQVLLETGTRQPVPSAAVDDVLAIVDGGEAVAVADARFEDSPRSSQTEAALIPAGAGESDDRYFGGGNELYGLGVGTPEMLDALDVPPSLRQELDDGAAIAVIRVEDIGEANVFDQYSRTQAPVPFGGSFDSPAASYGLPEVLVGPARAEQVGLEIVDPPRMLVDAGRPITGAERRALELLADDIAWNAGDELADRFVSIYWPGPEPALTPGEIRAIGYALLLRLIGAVVAAGLALAAKDSEDEARVLTAVGAPPRTVRRVGALRAGLLVATATMIALPAGLLPAWAIIIASRDDPFIDGARALPVHLDYVTLGVLVVAIPLAVMAVALGGAWLRDHARRPRPLVFALAD